MMVVAGQSGQLDESEPLVEAAVRLGGGTAQVATLRAEDGGTPTECLDEVATDASSTAALDDEEIVEARHAGDRLAHGDAHQAFPDPRLDHHRPAAPIAVLTEDRSIHRGPLACEEAAKLSALLPAETVGDSGGGLLGQLGTSLGDRGGTRGPRH
jgi:hypothetical protein